MLILLYSLGVLLGLYGIVKGADWLVDGSAALARKFRITEVVIGLTIVAFGTSMPEFVVSLFASLKGSGDMSVGNVMGSNIFNSLVILGATAFVAVVPVGRRALYVDIPWSILAAVACWIVCFDMPLWPKSCNELTRLGAGVFCCIFAVFMAYNFWLARRSRHAMEVVESDIPNRTILLQIVGGLTALLVGGRIMVNCASEVALLLHVSEAVIALTIVAGGTSAPELVTSIIAARKGRLDMAIGNAIGSNVFNVFFVLGLAGLISPMQIADINRIDLLMLVGGPILLWLAAFLMRRITRWMGALLVLVYLVYLVSLVRGAIA
ncbi:MAG: calcium/sodium antiporter [Bacteroidaceae bacterium]|nr:calcium/sodium antiporter [Bacteroidaceae bacterium]